MPIQVRDSNDWNLVSSLEIRDSGFWNNVQTMWTYTNEYGWKVVFPAPITPTVSISVTGFGANFISINVSGTNSVLTSVVVRQGSISGPIIYSTSAESPENPNNFNRSITSLSQQTTYFIIATALSASDNTATASTSATTGSAIIPTVNLSPTAVNMSSNSFGVTWDSTNQYNWRIIVRRTSNQQVVLDTLWVLNDQNTRSYFISGLTPSVTYSVTIIVESIDGNQASDIETFTTLNAVPVTINTFTSSSTLNSITYSWTATGQARGQIEFGVGSIVGGEPTFTGSTQIVTFTTQTSRSFTGLSSSTGYVARLTLWSINDDDDDSRIIYSETLSPSPPSAPNNFVGSASSDGTSASFTWSAPSSDGGVPIVRYEFQRNQSSTAGPTWLNLGLVFSNTSSGMTPGTTYYFRVRAVNSSGLEGAFSTVILTMPTLSVPGIPGNFSGFSSTDGTSITLSWTAPNNGGSSITSYEFQRNQSATAGPTWINIGNTTSWISSGTTPGTLYYFRIRAINAIGTGSFATTTVTANNPTPPPTTAPPTTAPPTTAPPTTAPPTTKAPTASIGPETKVLTSNYGYIEAKYLSVGDELISLDISEIPTTGETFNVDEWKSSTFTNNGLTTTIINNIYAKEIIGNMIKINGEWFTDNHNILSEKDGVYSFTPAAYLDTSHKVFDYDIMDWAPVYEIEIERDVQEIVYVLDCEPYDVFFTQNALVYNNREYI